MHMKAQDFRELAADLAAEHGSAALDYARRTRAALESEGALDRAAFWQTLCCFIDDIVSLRLDPAAPLTIN
ncbi:MAG: hypothetical protein GC166_09190 [Alphaproteobacteria bacterium]|nr:hypothetical protein [Alphaproteobacteria bacterium]